ncbi:MAG TPA: DUF2950 domain-containing protein, partial [Vicinamibacterales bacterium]|nr:DUF2950 domain-containing protein [Vicinamibacterales bacterium]
MRNNLLQSVAVVGALAVAGLGVSVAARQTPKPSPTAPPKAPPAGARGFATPQLAMDAALKAVAAGPDALLGLLGPDAKDLVTTTDPVADQKERDEFVRMAKEKTVFRKDPADATRTNVLIGNDGFPAAIPLVQRSGQYYWDVEGGRYELLIRRVGSNELDAITVCRGYVEAQQQYAALDPDKTGLRQYAQKIISTAGKHDGLYWPSAPGVPESPIGDAVAKAIAQGYSATNSPQPYHGYYFKVLTSQGPSAPLGEMDFMVQGHMIGGFALIAWPAQYRITGVKTFIVGSAGIVYEQDLGPDSANL